MLGFILRVKDFIIDSRLLISLASVSLYYCTIRISQIPFNVYYASFLFLGTFLTYNIPFFVNNRSSRLFKISMYVLPFFLALCGWLVLKCTENTWSLLTILVLFLIVLLYYLPFKAKSLRTIPFVKILLISFCWTVATAYLPFILHEGLKSGTEIYFLSLERFLFIFAITIPFDIRDINQDRQNGLITIPGAIGIKRAMILSAVTLILYILISDYNYGAGPLLYSRIVCSAFVLILLVNIKPTWPNHYFTGLIDGSMVLQCILLVAFS